jgi:hypothetical protein
MGCDMDWGLLIQTVRRMQVQPFSHRQQATKAVIQRIAGGRGGTCGRRSRPRRGLCRLRRCGEDDARGGGGTARKNAPFPPGDVSGASSGRQTCCTEIPDSRSWRRCERARVRARVRACEREGERASERACERACVRVCVRARACVRACVRASVRACVRACVRVCERACVRA